MPNSNSSYSNPEESQESEEEESKPYNPSTPAPPHPILRTGESATANEEVVVAVEDSSASEQVLDESHLQSTGDGDDGDSTSNGRNGTFSPRAYQIEMFEESMKGNIVVAMPTGSGKTHVAIMRIQAELDRSPPDKKTWFLAPTLELCYQQHAVINLHLPATPTLLLTGSSSLLKHPITTSTPSHWTHLLSTYRIIISTPQILLDAISHAFLSIQSLSLLIIDEAHSTLQNDPTAVLMRDLYHPALASGHQVPHILGLSASPVMNAKVQGLENMEAILNAVVRSPSLQREELLREVRIPSVRQVLYRGSNDSDVRRCQTLVSMEEVFRAMDEYDDPYIMRLLATEGPEAERQLNNAVRKRKTWCFAQTDSIFKSSRMLLGELGAWAVGFFVGQMIETCKRNLELGSVDVESCSLAEMAYLLGVLQKIDIPMRQATDEMEVSDKVEKFIEVLPRNSEFAGILFVKQRVTVAVLTQLLSVHPGTKDRFRVGSVVGMSTHGKKAMSIVNSINVEHQKNAMERFRAGKLDLIIATTVLEEGIDVPICNMVICFDEDINLKSFIQRRGRARARNSTLILIVASQSNKIADLEKLDVKMKAIYEDRERMLQEASILENENDQRTRRFEIPETTALLTLHNAISYLYRFCAMLPGDKYVHRRPEFIIVPGQSVRVILPKSIHHSVGEIRAEWTDWTSERVAKRDAAFEAYVALYEAGLINDHLLPMPNDEEFQDELKAPGGEKSPSYTIVDGQLNPWTDIAQVWAQNGSGLLKTYAFTPAGANSTAASIIYLTLPIEIPKLPPIKIFWNSNTSFEVTVEAVQDEDVANCDLSLAQQQTLACFKSCLGYRRPIREDAQFVVLVRPRFCSTNFEEYKSAGQLLRSASQIVNSERNTPTLISVEGRLYRAEEWLDYKPADNLYRRVWITRYDGGVSSNASHLVVSSFPRSSTNFLDPVPARPDLPRKKRSAVQTAVCKINSVPIDVRMAEVLIPSLLHRLEVYLIAKRLGKTTLIDVGFLNVTLVVTAISAPGSGEETNYERFEFLGDSLLKTSTAIQLLAEYPQWHEGYLSRKKDRIICNRRLAEAAVQNGLPKFILTQHFNARKWRPLYVDQLLSSPEEPERTLSSKVLADVVEALIGAAMIDGGWEKAIACMKVFLPEIEWQSLESRRATLYDAYPDISSSFPVVPLELEQFVGYKFTKKALLTESITHASSATGSASLERLEFLGDSILDHLVVRAIFQAEPELSHYRMHLLRTALVNADFLAFVCMEWSSHQTVAEVVEDDESHELVVRTSSKTVPLWKYLRHASSALGRAQLETVARHADLRDEINEALSHGAHHPWVLLSSLGAEKFFSDMIESLLGAIYIDSGSFDVCEGVLRQMGILTYLDRIVRDDVKVLHPKEELGQLADSETVKYEVQAKRTVVDDDDKMEYHCQLYIGDRLIVSVGNGCDKDQVQAKAAELAIAILNSAKEEAILS